MSNVQQEFASDTACLGQQQHNHYIFLLKGDILKQMKMTEMPTRYDIWPRIELEISKKQYPDKHGA